MSLDKIFNLYCFLSKYIFCLFLAGGFCSIVSVKKNGKDTDIQMSLTQDMKTAFFEMQLQHLKRRKKSPLTPKAADHILKNYKIMFHLDSTVSFSDENCREFIYLFSKESPAELAEWIESLFP